MPLYAYLSLNSQGKKIKQTIEALSESAAREKLRSQKIFILSIKEKKGSYCNSNELTGISLLTFTTQLAELLKASLPLYESLLSLEEEYAEESFGPIISVLCQRIKGGVPLSKALAEFPKSFSTHYIAMIEAGESVGTLDKSLESLATHLEKGMKLKKTLLTASLYPLILFSFSCLVIVALLTFVVPSLEAMLEDRPVGLVTSIVMTISHLFTNGWKLLLPFFSLSAFLIYYAWKKETVKVMFKEKLLLIPGINALIIEISLARFVRTLGTLLQGGVGMTNALPLARKIVRQPILEAIIRDAEKKILEGGRLSKELKKSKLIPPLVSRLILVGEESGKMAEMLLKLATHYEEEVEKKIGRLLSIFQPAMLLFLGVIVGLIMLGVLLPLTDIQAFTGG